MYRTLYILIVGCLLGCSNAKNEVRASDTLSTSNGQVTTLSTEGDNYPQNNPSSTQSKGLVQENKLYSYQFNERQFTAHTARLVKGTVVYDTQISTFGQLRGSFVLVSKSDLVALSSSFRIERIAGNTYRLIPIDSSLLLLDILKRLQKLGQVELEVDYTSRDKNSEM
ncbi:hypothetical protein [Shewanella xiamenensis]|uniref:hypothetical protein n=1 Tax=Shewanella xiamenensis TaxID=332186 RepID=UPI0016629AAB|nr:hypothetical protein [Shewanella xiamenensis]MCL1070245.1 hypothetical protein [Shewanella xiamenensis]GGM78838.1 hypothetical protein GCM10009124_01930 [Shewanella xiamenensis]